MRLSLKGKNEKETLESMIDVSLAEALYACQDKGYGVLFMPEIVDARLNASADSADSSIWGNWFTAPSLKATGRTKQGNSVVIYVHKDNYGSNPGNINEACRQGLVNGAGVMPTKEFQNLVDQDGTKDKKGNRLVWVIDYEMLKKSKGGIIPIEEALEHPQTKPFLGGEKRAKKYLEKHKQVYNINEINVQYSDDLYSEPLWRLLAIAGDYHLPSFEHQVKLSGGLLGGRHLFHLAHFILRTPKVLHKIHKKI